MEQMHLARGWWRLVPPSHPPEQATLRMPQCGTSWFLVGFASAAPLWELTLAWVLIPVCSCSLHPRSDSPAPLGKPLCPAIRLWEVVKFNCNKQRSRQLGGAKPKSGINYQVSGHKYQKQRRLLVCGVIYGAHFAC